MGADVEEIENKGIGTQSSARFMEIAMARARVLMDSDRGQERWVKPLIRAIRRKRLRLPVLSPMVQRVVKLTESPEVDLDELADAVSRDPVLSTRIMGVANSSYFRGSTEVPNVRDALMRMGVREARTQVIVVALRSTLLRSSGLGESAHRLWKHSLLVASAIQEITLELPPWESTGFLAGLLQDLGQLVVLAFVAELPAPQDDGSAPSEESVEAILDATHASLGAMVLASWGFPEEFCEAVLAHHNSSQAPESASSLARAMELGHHIADQIEEGWPVDSAELPECLIVLGQQSGVEIDRLVDIAAEAEANVEVLSKLS